MKKNYLKKSLSLVLTVLMLMSCWVFVAPEQSHVSAVEQTTFDERNAALISGLTLDASNPTTIHGTFPYDDTYLSDSNYSQIYKNVLNIGTVTDGSDGADAYVWSIDLKDGDAGGIAYYYPETTFLYDGVTTPTTGIMLNVDAYGSCKIRSYSGYVLTSGLKMMNTYWHGKDGRLNYQWCYFANSGNNCSTSDGSVNGSYCYTHESGGDSYFYANILGFSGSMADNEFVREITPAFGWKGNQASQGTGNVYTFENFTVNTKIRVINYKVLKAAINEAITVRDQIAANPGLYSTKSVQQFVTYANALMAAKPGNYVNADKNDYNGYASAASAAVSNWNNWYDNGGFVQRTYDVQAENLFSFADWAYSASSVAGSAYSFSYDVPAGSLTITTGSNTSEAVTAHSDKSTRNQNYYAVPVEGNVEYTLEWTASSSQNADKISSQMFCFFYDVNNDPFDSWADFSKSGSSNGTTSYTFTTPANAKYMEVRFDNNNDYYISNLTFSNIKLYKTSRATEIARQDWLSGLDIRHVYSYNAAVGTLETPVRKGYKFAGWQVDANFDGTPDTDVKSTDPIQLSWPLYAKWEIKDLDVGYDNLFSVSDWAYTDSTTPSNSSNGTIEYDIAAGTITAESTANGEVYTKYAGTGDYYRMDVEPGTEYIFEADMALATGTKGQMFVFFYDASGNGVTGATFNNATVNNPHIGEYPTTNGTHSMVFTTPADCTQIAIRVGATDVGTRATYSNIGIYKKADYDAYAGSYAKVREPFRYGDATKLMVPTREGYAFDGWTLADGTVVTTVSDLYESTIVYATWSKLLKVEFVNYDGTVMKTEYVAPGNDATAPVETPYKAPDTDYEYEFLGWDKSYKGITTDTVVTAQFQDVEHTGLHVTLSTPATCLDPGKVFKSCDCGYDWGEVYDDTGTYPKLDHDFADVVTGSSTGVDGQHKVGCTRCDAETMVDHNYGQSSGQSTATCTTPGETYYKCACGQEKTVTGTIDPNAHVYDYTTGTSNDDGETHTVYCTGDATHTTVSIDCTDDNKDCICDICGQELIHNYVNQTKDNLVSEAECGVDAVYYLTCQCGKYDTATWTDAGSALSHVYTTYTYNNDATCEVDGTKTASCDNGCGTTNTIKADGTALKHDYTGTVKDNGDGTHSYLCQNNCGTYGGTVDCSSWEENATEGKCECTVCGYTKTHAWGTWSAAADNTGDAAGKHTRTCEDCNAVEETECTDYAEVKTEATCTTDAYTTYTCADCGHGYTVIDKDTATGHRFDGAYTCDADADKHQQACTHKDCTAKGVDGVADAWVDCVWTYANIETGKHTATCVCGNSEEQTCTGGTATCTAQAICEHCGVAYGSTADHNYSGKDKYLFKATDATCTANETYYYYCIGCEKTIDGVGTYEKLGSELPHTYTGETWYDGAELAEEAKCEVNAKYYVYCSVCNASSKGTDSEATFEKDDTALEHSYKGTITCNNDGTHTIACERDGCTSTVTANCADSALTYGYEAPTCISQGYTKYQCSACSYAWNDNYEDALGHNYSEKIYNAAHTKSEATCEKAKIYWYDCSRCDKNAKDETDTDTYTVLTFESGNVREHSWKEKVADAYLADQATCTAAAKYYTSCEYEDCGKSSLEVLGDKATKFSSGAALGHDWVEPAEDEKAGFLAGEADCVTDATYYYVCSREACKISSKGVKKDGETWTDEGSKSGHSLTHHEAVEVTCEAAGNIEYWSCSRCNKNFSDEEGKTEITGSVAINALGHDWVKYSFKAATCEEDGHNAYEECSRCKEKKAGYTVYDKLGHNFTGAWTYDAVHNYHSKLCLNGCGASGMVVDGEQVKYTVTYEGLDYVYAGGEECDFTGEYTEYVDENGNHCHAIVCKCGNMTSAVCVDENPEEVAPTCTANGYTLHTCDVCSAQWKTDEVAAEGHKYGDAKSNEDGTHSAVCSACGDKQNTAKCSGGTATCSAKAKCEICGGEYGEKGDHVLDENAWVSNDDAKCGVDGTKSQNCSVCDEKVTVTDKGTALQHEMSGYIYDLTAWDGMPEDFDEASIKAPTCAEEGKKITYCLREGCDYYKTQVVPKDKNAHKFPVDENGEIIYTNVGGNCATGISYVAKCELCGAVTSKVDYDVAHEWKEIVIVNGTCDTNGYITYECNNCSFVRNLDENTVDFSQDTVEFEGMTVDITALKKTGHEWGETIVSKAATCSQKGRGYQVCAKCQATQEVEIDVIAGAHDRANYGKDGNNLKKVAEVAPTCNAPGHAEYYECTRCSFSENANNAYYIAPTGHADNDGDGDCDTCKKELDTSGSGNCSCICHKESGFMKFIYKILRFFWKLFKINKSCSCGFVHY